MNARAIFTFALIALIALSHVATGQDVPFLPTGGVKEGDVLSPRANAYRSRRTLMPFNYYSIPVCKPSKEKMKRDKANEKIGELLTGNRLVPTLFEFKVKEDVACKELCWANFNKKDLRRANYMIENKYDVRMFLNGHPLVSTKSEDNNAVAYRKGYAFAPQLASNAKKDESHSIYNHLNFTIRYKVDIDNSVVIIGFHVTPLSYAHIETCSPTTFLPATEDAMKIPSLKMSNEASIPYSYSIRWEENENPYNIEHSIHETTQKRGHRIAAMYGVLLTVLMGVVVAFVMLRTVRKDLAIYLDEELNETEMREESGWKLVRGDVFRPPPYAVVFSTLVGAGCQIAITVLVTMILCSTGGVNPQIRGHFLTTIIIVFLFMHIVSGFATSRLLKLFGVDSWKTAMRCMVAFPLALGSGMMMLNFMHWMKHTTAAIPLGTVVAMALTWVLVSVPLGAAGVFVGFSMDKITVTAKVSSIPRLIPAEAGGYTLYYVVLGSLVPFVACCVEVSYVLNAFWREEQLLMFGVLTFFLCVVAMMCFEVGIVVTYFTLRNEDYRWWWRSFATLAVTGVYLFGYSIFFLKHSLEIRLFSSIILFLAYMVGVSVMFGVALGTVSFIGSFWLVQRMYGAIKAD